MAFAWETADFNGDKDRLYTRLDPNWANEQIQRNNLRGVSNSFSGTGASTATDAATDAAIHAAVHAVLVADAVLADDIDWWYLGGQKVASLSGDVSTLSDLNGIAEFPNLTVMGSTSNFVFLHFLCGGEVRGGCLEEESVITHFRLSLSPRKA